MNKLKELLATVNPSLLAAYEKANMGNVTFAQRIEEHAREKRIARNLKRWFWVGFVGLLACLLVPIFMEQTALLCIVVGLAFFLTMTVSLYRSPRHETNVACYESTAQMFENDLGELNHSGKTITEYNPASIRDELLYLAVQIVKAERRFDGICPQGVENVEGITLVGREVMDAREELRVAFASLNIFGLSFSKEKLFADAKKAPEQKD